MSDRITPASPASAFKPQADSAAVELPVSRDEAGSPLVVHIRRVTVPDVVRCEARLNTGSGPAGTDPHEMAETAERMERAFAELGRVGITSPEFAFDGEDDGRPAFGDLPWLDRSAIFNAIRGLAGLAAIPEGVRTFRGGALQRPAHGDAGGPAGPDGPGTSGEAAVP